MAEAKKRGDKYRLVVMIRGQRHSGTFDTKQEAKDWEASLRVAHKKDPDSPLIKKRYKLADAVDRYLETVSVTKRDAEEWERRRFNDLIDQFPGYYMDTITSDHISKWRDKLLKRVSGSTVNRYFNLYSNLFTVAGKEWRWVKENPFHFVKRPKENPPREQVWRWQQIKQILREGQKRGGKYAQVTQAFHIALRTGMRLQEALAAPANHFPLVKVVSIKKRKEDRRPINIPLTYQGNRVVKKSMLFTVSANEASTLFCKLRKQIGINDLEFKDSRATAFTLMAKRMPVHVLQRISRHKDINLLTSVYYRATAEEIAATL
jgi:integrase